MAEKVTESVFITVLNCICQLVYIGGAFYCDQICAEKVETWQKAQNDRDELFSNLFLEYRKEGL